MRVKEYLLGLLLLGLLSAVGCDFSGDDPDDDALVVDRTLIVEHGAQPHWIGAAEQDFLFVYQEGEGPIGIYLSTMQGDVTPLYEGSHNHDYVSSPNGALIAFSTPVSGGGVLVSDLDGNSELLLAGGFNPAWIDIETLIATDANGNLVKFSVSHPQPETIMTPGTHAAVSPDGTKLAYLVNSSNTGLALRWVLFEDLLVTEVADRIGMDFTWSHDGQSIVASQLLSGTLSDIIQVPLELDELPITLISGAYRPSLSEDGNTLFANRVTNGGEIQIVYRNLSNGSREVIPYAINPCAGNGRHALVEQTGGIYYISF